MQKMYKVEILPLARKDMLETVAYVNQTLLNPAAALRLAEKMMGCIERLCESPHRYPIFYPIKPLKHDYRRMPVDNYLVFYWVEEQEKVVTIARVVYAKREYEKLL